jgi:K+-sensing histidine kinase KdpD
MILFFPDTNPNDIPILIMWPAVALVTWYGGFYAGLFTTIVGLVVFDYFCYVPVGVFKIDPVLIFQALVLFLFTVWIGWIRNVHLATKLETHRLKQQILELVEGAGDPLFSLARDWRFTHAHQELRKAETRTASLQVIIARLTEAVTFQQVAGVIAREAIILYGARACIVGRLVNEYRSLELFYHCGDVSEGVAQTEIVPLDRRSILGDAVRSRRAIWVESGDDYVAQYPYRLHDCAGSNIQTLVALPLVTKGTAVGVLALSFDKKQRLPAADRDFILTLAQQCAQALDRARLYEP